MTHTHLPVATTPNNWCEVILKDIKVSIIKDLST